VTQDRTGILEHGPHEARSGPIAAASPDGLAQICTFEKLFKESKDAVVIAATDGKLFEVNQSALLLFGYAMYEMMSMSFKELYIYRDERKRFQREMKRDVSLPIA